MEIGEESAGGVLTLILLGRLDVDTAPVVEAAVLGHVAAGEQRIVFDLAAVDYISSIGLRVFMLAGKRLRSTGGKVAFCGLQGSVKQIFEIAGFARLFPAFETRAQAAEAIA